MSNAASVPPKLPVWLRGNPGACGFIATIFRVLHVWDDLIDLDRPASAEEINSAMWGALVEIPQNPFYRQHVDQLQPILQMGILNWHTANALEASPSAEDKRFAFVLRAMVADLIPACALIVGGPEWARHVHLELQKSNDETFEQYLTNLTREPRVQRKGN